jgi:hypothetical protein
MNRSRGLSVRPQDDSSTHWPDDTQQGPTAIDQVNVNRGAVHNRQLTVSPPPFGMEAGHILAHCLESLDASRGEEGGRGPAHVLLGFDQPITLRWVLLHVIEETAHHAGHADATREMLHDTTGRA